MNSEAVVIITFILTGLMMGGWYWNERVRRLPLEKFGLESVKRVLRWEPDCTRREILTRGWMTSHEWTQMNLRQINAINLEREPPTPILELE